MGMSLLSCYLATIGGYTDRPTDTGIQQFFYCSICCHVNVFTELSPSNENRNTLHWASAYQSQEGCTYRHTDWWEGFMKYTVEVGSGAMIHIPSFIKIGSGIRKLIGGIHRLHGHRISVL
jgi:hypothetical protein